MPCSKYKGAQRRLCYATDEWENWEGIKMKMRGKYKRGGPNRCKKKDKH